MITTGAICISEVFMGKCSLQVLYISSNNIGDDGITAIAGTLSNSQISKLHVRECGITLTGVRSLAAGLLVNNSVMILDVSHNDIGDDGITDIAGTLSNSQISELDVSECGITLTGVRSLAAGLLVNNSVRILNVSRNNIGDDGITAIAGTLSNSQISKLDVRKCGITLTGARSLAAGLLVNNSVRILDVSSNNIGDDGITAIAGTLSNSQISMLLVGYCGITLTGARSLAAGLLVNNSIRILDVWGNPFTVEGACLILQSAVDNGVSQQVRTNEGNYDDEVKKMMTILEQRQEEQWRIQEEQRRMQEVRGCVTLCYML